MPPPCPEQGIGWPNEHSSEHCYHKRDLLYLLICVCAQDNADMGVLKVFLD